jgi:hypothetical protein
MDFIFDTTFNGLDVAFLLVCAFAALAAHRLASRKPPMRGGRPIYVADDLAVAREVRATYDGLPYRGYFSAWDERDRSAA